MHACMCLLIYGSSLSLWCSSVVWLRIVHYCTTPIFHCSVKFLHKNITILQKSFLCLCQPKPYVLFFSSMQHKWNWIKDEQMVIVLCYCLACWYYILSFIVQTYRHIGTYNETIKCCLENYTELEWKSMYTSLVNFCQHLNAGAPLVFVWCEFTHGQVWSSLGVVTGNCKEYTHSTMCFHFGFDIVWQDH